MRKVILFLILIFNLLNCEILYKFNVEKDGVYFLRFQGKLQKEFEQLADFIIKLDGKEILHKQGWNEGYLPSFIPIKKIDKNFWELIYTVPLNLKKGENEISLDFPENTIIKNIRISESIEGKIKKDIQITGTQFIFFKKENPQISFILSSDFDKKIKGTIYYFLVKLLDDKGEQSWSPGLRFVPIDMVGQKELIIEFNKEKKKDFLFDVPKDKYGTISVFLILQEKEKILPLHILNYAIVFERELDKFNYNGLFICSSGHEILKNLNYLKGMKKTGIDWVRYEVGWNGFEPKKGEFKWENIDKFMDACRENKIYVITLTEGAPDWAKPKGDFIDIPYKNFKIKLDWSCGREYYDDWKNAWKEFLKRYKDVCRALNVWNEPWEGGGISGWKSTGEHYRNLFRKVKQARDEVDKDIKIVGADSSHNTNWKILAAGMENDIDILSIHYELPLQGCYSPSLANYYGKEVWDTETWITWIGDSASVREMLYEIALGVKKISPFVTSLIFDKNGFPNTSVPWTSAFSRFLNNKEYKGFAHPERPPFVLLFKGDDENVAVVSTSLCGVYNWRKNVFWGQFYDDRPDMIIDDIQDLKVYDIYGNEIKTTRKNRKIYIPVDKNPKYITTKLNFDKFRQILSNAYYDKLTPVEIKVFQIGKDNKLFIELKNQYPVKIKGSLIIKSEKIEFEKEKIEFILGPSEKNRFIFNIKNLKDTINNYPAEIIVITDKGIARLKEDLVFCIIKKGKILVDGEIRDWEKLGVKSIILTKQEEYQDLTIKAWYPWEKFVESMPDFSGEVSFAYDDEFLYGLVRVKDKTKDILPSLLSGKNLHKFQNPPGDYVYAEIGPIPGATGDMIKISLGPIRKEKWDRKYELFPPESPIYKFGHYLNAIYQYLIYPTKENNGEIMRVRRDDFYYLHPLPIDYKFLSEKCKVEGSNVFIKVDENGYIYEFSIPWKELSKISPVNNKRIKLSFQIQDKGMGNVLEFSKNKSICSVNTLDFEPGWGAKWTAETEFDFDD
ncbi:MAG: beta-galactosidase [Candidatus Omnitrophica bacterium]|nr:beta-galactosidase [Candidatus Omnitrophota bacterium]